jgi:hypothetical protein
MGDLTIWHWLLVIVITASPLMGVFRGIERNSLVHAALSIIIPLYGLVYFFVAARKTNLSPVQGGVATLSLDPLPLRRTKWLAALLAMIAFTTLLHGEYLSFLSRSFTLLAIWFLAGYIEPLNKFKSPIVCKALRTVLLLGLLVFVISELTHRPVADLLQAALLTAKSYLP